MLKSLASTFALALLLIGNAFSLSTYSVGLTSQTSVTVTNSQHGFNSDKIAIHAYDASGNRVSDSVFTKSINSGTYEVTVNFASAFTGTLKLSGSFTTADITNASKDFDAAVETGIKGVKICSTCTSSNFAFAGAGTKKFYSTGPVTYVAVPNLASEVFVYLKDGKTVFQVQQSNLAGTCSGGNCEVLVQQSKWPSGVEKLWQLGFDDQPGTWPGMSDKRAWPH